MECVWDGRLLDLVDQLPPELLQIISQGSNEQYLEAFTRTSLDPRYTYILHAHAGNLFPHICASLRGHASFATTLAALGRIVPHAPYLTPYATLLLEREQYDFGDTDGELSYLLGLFRLLRLDPYIFGKYVPNTRLMSRLASSSSRAATYLIIRILQITLKAADHWFETMVQHYLGDDASENTIEGQWDDRTIDYRFLSLWEEHSSSLQLGFQKQSQMPTGRLPGRVIPQSLLHPATVLIGGVLLPKLESPVERAAQGNEHLVITKTIANNLSSIAKSLKSSCPLLLTGVAGSGKTLLIRHAARALNKLETMVTLHLNEQSDAKLLLGVYTTGETAGSFVWKPGVLTTAVQEGRWVLIEDLDRAPNEVLGTLLPLIEKRELLIPNRKDTIYAAEGFRIVATVRSNINHRNEESKPLTHMLGFRHWQVVSVGLQSLQEHADIIAKQYPSLHKLVPQFMAVYERLSAEKLRPTLIGQSKTGVVRPISPRDLLKWCERVAVVLKDRKSFTSNEIDAIFLEALDCFMGALPDGSMRDSLAAVIAEELHIDTQRRDYLLHSRDVQYQADKSKVVVGRYSVRRAREGKVGQGTFSTNPHTTRMLERVAAAVTHREPLLLVGETGVGKTTAVQHLATHLGKKLVPFNMSQQSEVGDLLGGFKPINTRTLMIPLKEEFDDLFSESFSEVKNRAFLATLNKCMSRGNWKKVCDCFQLGLKQVDEQRLKTPPPREGEAPSKRQKTESAGRKRAINFAKWDTFKPKIEAIRQKLASGSEAFAFTFVEGNIIKAVRNGDWVLLDEINLASPDTLESIADLLDPAPSILLTESGVIERIEAHSDFRLFAAMNPATDVGKKDLPPGIRSRFTEIYVDSPDKDRKSLESIVRAYLRHEAAADVAIATDVSKLYQGILKLADENKLVDGAGQKPHFSLRTLTRTLSYAKRIQQMCNLRRALYEGFQMSFLTFLDFESAQLVEPLIQHCLFAKIKNSKAALQRPLRQPEPEDGRTHVQGYPQSKHWIRQGTQEPQDQPYYIITPFVQRNLENLVRAASTRQFPVLIQGPTSAGKTSMIEYLAKRTGHQFTRINNHEHTDLQEYLGSYIDGADGRFQFQEGVLVKALREGHWIVLDELNLAPTDVLEALNRLLDDNRELLVPETQEIIRPHPDFMLFATQNPAGLYGGRKTLSRAFRNRFLELHFDDIPVHELQTILHQRTQLPPKWCARVVTVYKEVSILRQENRLFEQKSFATLRDLFRWALRPNHTIHDLAANGYMLLCERVRKPEERVALKKIIETAMSDKGPKVVIDEEALYASDCPELQSYQQNATNNDVVWTKAMRRLYVLVSRAIAKNEPVLLVGETGCGKTTVCQMLSDALRKTLHTVNAHQNTETADLIGSQRPVRNRAATEEHLRAILLRSPLLAKLPDPETYQTNEILVEYDRTLVGLTSEEKARQLQDPETLEIRELRLRSKKLFEWVDGSLVNAMREGDLFLLDEISLADDSVLERINSVLESSRTILLAEKGSLDSFVTADVGFQFFATMNPGGDYGKRELSPALRNRFTEIWVPAMSDTDDILQIVQSKLVASAQLYAKAMIDFASWFKSRFDTSASSSVSIRDTLAWVQFVNAFAHAGVADAVMHGAAMVYIDTLGANPAGLITLSSSNINTERAICQHRIGQLLGVDGSIMDQASFAVQTTSTCFGIGPFTIPRLSSFEVTGDDFTFDPPTTKSNAMRMLRALQLSKPVMLEGSPGVGKTALVTAIAKAAARSLTRINLSDQTDLLDLFGSDAPVEGAQTGTFMWRDAPFLRAMKRGEWVLLDEMNLASQSVLEGLNACLDHRGEVFVPELGQSFTKHPDFRLFAAQNPHHQGGGRKGLPASFVNRFTVVYADSFRADDLTMICSRTFSSLDTRFVQRAVELVMRLNNEVANKHRFGTSGGPWEFNLRDTFRWLELASSKDGLLQAGTPVDFTRLLFRQRFRTLQDQTCVDELFADVFPDSQSASDLFYGLSTTTLQLGLGLLSRDDTNAKPPPLEHWSDFANSSFLRAMESTMLCVSRNWPTILTGQPGTGKTTLIDRVATAVGAEVVTLGMSAETDALDLIGGYEQHDPHRQSTAILIEAASVIHRLCKGALATGHADDATALRGAFEPVEKELQGGSVSHETISRFMRSLPAWLPEREMSTLLQILEPLRNGAQTIDKAQFEWIEGPLIEALQKGKWLVLDNANLCSASVLDRLNGLMEPNGVLIVNEHTDQHGFAQIIKPHPDFRIFLTVDPRHGELSRAMRNRGVEIFLMPVPEDAATASTAGIDTESAVCRFKSVKSIAGNEELLAQSQELALDHLGVGDQSLLTRFQHQLSCGLYQGRSGMALAETSLVVTDFSQLQSLYSGVASYLQAPADFACVQTFHPLNNQPLVQQSQQIFNTAFLHGMQFDLGVLLNNMMRALASAKKDRKLVDRLTKLWKSSGRGSNSSKNGLLDAVELMLVAIQSSMQQMGTDEIEALSSGKRILQCLLAFCSNLLVALNSPNLDLPQLTACALVGQAICQERLASASATQNLLQPFAAALKPLGLTSDGDARHTFVAMWNALRPKMPSDMETLQALIKFEALIEKYDRATADFSRPVEEMVQIRYGFQRNLSMEALSAADWNALIESVNEHFPEARATSGLIDNPVQLLPHFQDSFEHLCQLFALFVASDSTFDSQDSVRLEILAQRGTVDGLECTRAIEKGSAQFMLRGLGLSAASNPGTTALQPAATAKTLRSALNIVNNVNLANLNLLETESKFLGQLVASGAHNIQDDVLQPLDRCLLGLLASVLEIVSAVDELGALREYCARLLDLLRQEEKFWPGDEDLKMPSIESTLSSVSVRLGRVTKYLCRAEQPPEGMTKREYATETWNLFGLACLDLYLPQDAFDPVQQSQFHIAVHQRRRSSLQAQVKALQAFQSAWVGESGSLRARLLEDDLKALGESPPGIDICRPEKSLLAELQGDLRALMRILAPLRDCKLLDEGSMGNVRVLRSRLKGLKYRAYADLVNPVIGFVDCIQVAHGLATPEGACQGAATSSPASLTPLGGAKLEAWLSEQHFISMQQYARSKEEHIFWLSAVAVRATVVTGEYTSMTLYQSIDASLRHFYEAWKTELSRDQKAASARSSLYQYRGGEDDSEEATAEQVEELFPSYDGESTVVRTPSRIDAQALAPTMARLHHQIFSNRELEEDQLLGLLQQASQLPSADRMSNMTAIMISLHKLSRDLSTSTQSRNIYTDRDLAQSKALVALVSKIQSRFTSIHNSWPDHAVPIDVLKACNQTLAIGHAEPVARYLQPVETIYSAMNEWQKVASSEYSAAMLLEETTNLIVGWRQLELSTWAALFEQEDEACRTNAASWWYIAYEAIVVASEAESRTPDTINAFAYQLPETLGSFLSNCGLGEFDIRLAMLKDFEAKMAIRAKLQPILTPVREALSSLISYYNHFAPSVSEHLAKKRAELEKQVKEIIKLASWKDRNVERLRDNARKSHKKLFRVVRKYRVLLSDPVAPLLLAELPGPREQNLAASSSTYELDFAVESVPVVFKAWKQRPKELQDLDDIRKRIAGSLGSVEMLAGASKRIAKFIANLEEEASELRKSTPSTATEENKTLIQHLKTRKRRLLADVLRDVRLMGFQTNLSDDILTQQSSLHGVLSKSPPLTLHGSLQNVEFADHGFHRLLHTMPTVRESAVKHNEDLTPAEIARSKTLLESMLQVSIEQRTVISRDLVHLTTLQSSVAQLTAIASAGDLAADGRSVASVSMLSAKTASLSGVLRATVSCVLMQSELAGRDYNNAVNSLQATVTELEALKKSDNSRLPLPPGLTSNEIQSLEEKYTKACSDLDIRVYQHERDHPELGSLLGELHGWLQTDNTLSHRQGHAPVDVNAWVDNMLCLIQNVHEKTTEPPATVSNGSGAAKKAWLTDQQNQMTQHAQSMAVGEISSALTTLIAQTPQLRGKSKQDVALPQVSSICRQVQPVLRAYLSHVQAILDKQVALHVATTKMAHRLSLTFVDLAQHGFCQPSVKAQGEDQSGQVESGTGLGDGEGGEDISKDVGADEDLSELAQDATAKDKEGENEAEKDAVDMADEDLEGKFDEDAGSEGDEEEGGEKDDDEEADLDEETGHVGEDDDAVDEKTWDDGEKEDRADKEAEKGKGTKNDDHAAAENAEAGETQEVEDQHEGLGDEAEDGDEMDDVEAEGSGREPEQADPHMQEEENLDLPEDLNIDGDAKSISDIDAEDDLPDDLGDADARDDEEAPQEGQEEMDVEMGEGEANEDDQQTGDAKEDENNTAEEQGDDAKSDVAMLENEDQQKQPDDGLTSADAGQGQEEDEAAAQKSGAVTADEQQDDTEVNESSEQAGATEGTQRKQTEDASGQAEAGDQQQSQPFKQLGDVLNQWYNQHRNIEAAQEPQEPDQRSKDDVNVSDPRFEHLPENTDSDMQALGAANVEQSKALDEENAIDVNESAPDDVPLPEEANQQQEEETVESTDNAGAKTEGGDGGSMPNQTMVGKPTDVDTEMLEAPEDVHQEENNIEDVDEQLTNTHLDQDGKELISIEDARKAWSDHETRTRNMAIVLTEHLRLILQPTQATKMRGDFRTGKRLNIKKIIPYIASDYKRDKIWMRRSIPSKRSYQIMLAIDDSESMNENERKGLAFDTLALVAKSMSMLEVGELSILGFGETTNIAHEFSMPFTSDAGAEVYRQFNFSQTKTDVKRLLEKSIELFRAARLKATGSASNLWQLQLIISDGLCEDHVSIRQLIRQAHEEQLMMVFIVVDAMAQENSVSSGKQEPRQSINDLSRVEFKTDANGEPQVVKTKYMDTFPFRYYLTVGDVLELPGVLATALRQWFAEVVESDG